MQLSIHHVAIISSDIERAKRFYVEALGFSIISEHYREEKRSWKVNLAIDEHTQIELFSFQNPPTRITNPEACGLRHLAFRVDNLNAILGHLQSHHIESEPIRTDEFTGKRFTFVKDPDHLPIEFYEQ